MNRRPLKGLHSRIGPRGTVTRTAHPVLGETALKTFHLQVSDPVAARKEFAALVGRPSIPGVATVFEAVLDVTDHPVVTTAWAPWGGINELISSAGPLPTEEFLVAAAELAVAVAGLHAHGWLHGNIKPSNVLVVGPPATDEFHIALTDALMVSVAAGRPTVTGDVSDVTTYQPPEVLEGYDWTEAGDVYALAATCYFLLAGRPPYGFDALRGTASLLLRIFAGPVPRALRPDVPEEILDLLTLAMAADATARSVTAADLARRLTAALANHRSGAGPVNSEHLPTVLPGKTQEFMGRPLGSQWVLQERIGTGSMGEVWRAVHRTTGQTVAAKVLRPQLAANSDVVHRFLNERRLLEGLHHPNLVEVRGLVAEGDTLAILMDLVDGSDLRAHLTERRTLRPAEACQLLAQVAAGLEVIHRGGTVHRDLKPENVLLEVEPGHALRARITDFGVARSVAAASITQHGSFLGTPDYMAPETGQVDATSPPVDIYALGVMGYEMLTGRRPITGDGAIATLMAHRDRPVHRPDGLDDRLWAVLAACLAKPPFERPAAADVAMRFGELARQLEGAPALAPLTGPPAGWAGPPSGPRFSGPAPLDAPTWAGPPPSSRHSGPTPGFTPQPGAWAEPSLSVSQPLGTFTPAGAADAVCQRAQPAEAGRAAPGAGQFEWADEPSAPAVRSSVTHTVMGVLPEADPGVTSSEAPRMKRWPLWVALATAVVVMAVAGAWYGQYRARQAQPPPPSTAPRAATKYVLLPTHPDSPAPGRMVLTFPDYSKKPGFQTYQVFRDSTPLKVQVPTGRTVVEIRDLDPSTSYCFVVVAVLVTDEPQEPNARLNCLAPQGKINATTVPPTQPSP